MDDSDPYAGLPLLWLTGPPGVGKSTVGHALFARLAAAGVPAAYVDVDQVGMCYPAPPEDPGNDGVKSRALAAVVAGHRAAGARCVVVSGGVEHGETLRRHLALQPGLRFTLARLRAADDVLVGRIRGRGASGDAFVRAALRSAAELEATRLGDLVLETDGRSVEDLVTQLAGWPGELARPFDAPPPTAAPVAGGTPVVWLCGPPGVGKSTVGWQLYAPLLTAGTRAGYLDLAQLSFGPSADPLPHTLPGCWATFLAAGAQELVLSGPVPDAATGQRLLGLLPGTRAVLVRLHATGPTLAERIRRRGEGRATELPGDPLRFRSPQTLLAAAAAAAREGDRLEAAGVGDVRVVTDGLTPDQVAALVREALATAV